MGASQLRMETMMLTRWHAARLRRALIALGIAAAVASCSSPTAVAVPTVTPAPSPTPGATATVENQPIPGGPVLLRADMSLRKVIETGGGAAKLALNPADGKLYYLMLSDGVFRVDASAGASPTSVHVVLSDTLPGGSEGLAFGQD